MPSEKLQERIKQIIESHLLIDEKFRVLRTEASHGGYLDELSKTCEIACDDYLKNRTCFEDLQHASVAIYHAALTAENAQVLRKDFQDIWSDV
jgi:hypothetical protein